MKQGSKTNLSTKQRIKQLFVSSRPVLWINTAFPFVAGYIATGQSITWYFIVASFYFLIPYNLLIYVINDVFDYESDINNPRKNSIEGGLLPPETHRFMLLATLLCNAPFIIYLCSLRNIAVSVFLLLIIVGAIAYSVPPFRLKELPVIDSINSSFHFISPLVFALLLSGWKTVYWPYVLAFFLWGCASHAFGAIQDIIADRKAHIRSIATTLGARRTVQFSAVLYTVAAILLVSTGWPALIIGIFGFLYTLVVLQFAHIKDNQATQANRGWKQFLVLNQMTGFIITIVLIMNKLIL